MVIRPKSFSKPCSQSTSSKTPLLSHPQKGPNASIPLLFHSNKKAPQTPPATRTARPSRAREGACDSIPSRLSGAQGLMGSSFSFSPRLQRGELGPGNSHSQGGCSNMPLSWCDGFPVRQEKPPLSTVLRQVTLPTLGVFEEASWSALGTAQLPSLATSPATPTPRPPTICGRLQAALPWRGVAMLGDRPAPTSMPTMC